MRVHPTHRMPAPRRRMNRKIHRIIWWSSVCFQVLLMAGMVVLQKLSGKKAGVNHHLYCRKIQYQNRLFTPPNRILFTAIACLLIVVFLLLFFRKRSRYSLLDTVISLAPACWSTLFLCFLHLPFFQELLIYPYLLAATAMALLLSIVSALPYLRAHAQQSPQRGASHLSR